MNVIIIFGTVNIGDTVILDGKKRVWQFMIALDFGHHMWYLICTIYSYSSENLVSRKSLYLIYLVLAFVHSTHLANNVTDVMFHFVVFFSSQVSQRNMTPPSTDQQKTGKYTFIYKPQICSRLQKPVGFSQRVFARICRFWCWNQYVYRSIWVNKYLFRRNSLWVLTGVGGHLYL